MDFQEWTLEDKELDNEPLQKIEKGLKKRQRYHMKVELSIT